MSTVLSVPFRMSLGLFGIWLANLGRVIQIRVADWNTEIRIEHEFYRAHTNRNVCRIHTNVPISNLPEVTFSALDDRRAEQSVMVRAMFKVPGVASVSLRPYKVVITKSHVFDWSEVLPAIDRIIVRHNIE